MMRNMLRLFVTAAILLVAASASSADIAVSNLDQSPVGCTISDQSLQRQLSGVNPCTKRPGQNRNRQNSIFSCPQASRLRKY